MAASLALNGGPVVALGDRRPDRLDLVVEQLLRLGAGEIGVGQPLRPVRLVSRPAAARNAGERLAARRGRRAGPASARASDAAPPNQSKKNGSQRSRSPPSAEGAEGGVDQRDVRLRRRAAAGPAASSMAARQRARDRRRRSRSAPRPAASVVGDQAAGAGQLLQVPEHRLRLAAEGCRGRSGRNRRR